MNTKGLTYGHGGLANVEGGGDFSLIDDLSGFLCRKLGKQYI